MAVLMVGVSSMIGSSSIAHAATDCSNFGGIWCDNTSRRGEGGTIVVRGAASGWRRADYQLNLRLYNPNGTIRWNNTKTRYATTSPGAQDTIGDCNTRGLWQTYVQWNNSIGSSIAYSWQGVRV